MNTRTFLMAFGLLALSSMGWAIQFTGKANVDFSNSKLTAREINSVFHFDNTEEITSSCSTWMTNRVPPRRSGMDMDAVHMMYDDIEDKLYIGIECGAICGDTDGDGNPSGVDPAAPTSGVNNAGLGSDLAGMCDSEQFSWMIWNNPPSNYILPREDEDFYPNIIVGLRTEDCLVNSVGQTELRAYEFNHANCVLDLTKGKSDQTAACRQTASRATQCNLGFGQVLANKFPGVIPPLEIDPHKSLYLNATYPHVEFALPKFSKYPTFNTFDTLTPFEPATETKAGQAPFRLAFQGLSAAVDSCGEDKVLPEIWEIKWDCSGYPNGDAEYDVCGECAGPGLKCLDCFGVANGTAKYDDCGVCNGTNLSCQDCFYVPYGPAVYDECGVCGGNNLSCADCAYVPNGKAVYDECGVCDGDNTTCADCFWVPNGPAVYDECGICGGDSTFCQDCNYVPNGPSKYDACGVCDGDNTTCDDCFGVPYGPAVYDECGVCDGDNTTCDDCFGVPHGTAVYDECNICGGNNKSCADCFGVPNGDAVVDACHVCGGDNTTCDDCDGVPYGDAKYDRCGVCNGDNSTCTCYKYLGWEAPELCHGLLRWSVAASQVKLRDTLDVLYAIKSELPHLSWKGAGAFLPNYLDTVHMFCDECLDNFDYAQAWFADRLAGNCIGANCEDLAVDQMSWQL